MYALAENEVESMNSFLPVQEVKKETVKKTKTPFRKGDVKVLKKNLSSDDIKQYKYQLDRFKKMLNSTVNIQNKKTFTNYINELNKRLKIDNQMKKAKSIGRSFKPKRYNKSEIYIIARDNGIQIKDVIKELKRKALVENPSIIEISKAVALNAVGEKDFEQEYVNHEYDYLAEAVEIAKDIPEIQTQIDLVNSDLDQISVELASVVISPVETINNEVVNSPVKTLVVDENEPLSPTNVATKNAISTKVENTTDKKSTTDIKKVAMIGGGLLLAMQMFS